MATKQLSNDRLKAHIETLGNAGDLNALPGSRPWAIAVKLEMQAVIHDAVFNAQQLKAWRDLMKEYDGYQQLVDEHGKPFKTYEELCKAQPPFGLGCEPLDIDKLISELELSDEKTFELEKLPLKQGGNPKGYLQRFSQVVQACPDNQPLNVEKIREVLQLARSKAHIWRKRWYDLGWIEALPSNKRGYYQITEEGRKVAKDWLEELPSATFRGGLWLNIPRHNSKKAAEQLIQALDSEQLQEIYSLISKSLNQDSS
ncbi:hypothetical protein FNW02_03635 [Komarekiella sp. 'clone 1']|uniref:Uncharacterized protein n=1 Tax=Komarekiella delphini-convector SJRDD-AB1 TaxID=2593771 RepID=A0AA40STG6_9NOST|nr:hypothetical protein [Komarekiella delphini-convector]MBD6614966.1 hypothetical protein [Komarekiella delphini-convector SJRDD-AB1]